MFTIFRFFYHLYIIYNYGDHLFKIIDIFKIFFRI